MGVVRTILLVLFIIVSIILVLLVLVQNDNSNGMGGAFGGAQTAAFGSHSASILTKTTGVLVGVFFIAVFVLALLNKAPSGDSGLGDTASRIEAGSSVTGNGTVHSWVDEDDSASDNPGEQVITSPESTIEGSETEATE